MTTLLNEEADFSADLVGVLLNQYEGVPAKDIIVACESNDFQGIYQQAKDKLVAEELYQEWLSVYYPQWQHKFYGNNSSKKSDVRSK